MKNTCVLSCLAPEPSGQEKLLTILELALLLLFCVVFSLLFSPDTTPYCCMCCLSLQCSAAGARWTLSASLLEMVFQVKMWIQRLELMSYRNLYGLAAKL